MRGRFSVSLLVLCFALSAIAQGRSLYWSALDVEAKLAEDGVLHVDEKQSIVFDGAWNGGERRFDIRPGQTLQLQSIEEIDLETGTATPLREGDRRFGGVPVRSAILPSPILRRSIGCDTPFRMSC